MDMGNSLGIQAMMDRSKNPYEKYKNRLASQLQENPELRLMNRAIATNALPFQQLNNQLQSMLQQTNASAGAKAAATMRGQMQLQDERQGMYSQALTSIEQRGAAVAGKMAEISDKEAEWEAIHGANEQEKQTKALRGAIQLAGMAVGAAFGSPQAGAGAGQALGGFVAIDKNGQLTAKPEYWDIDATLQGGGQLIAGISQIQNEKKMQQSAQELGGLMSDPENAGFWKPEAEGGIPTAQLEYIKAMTPYELAEYGEARSYKAALQQWKSGKIQQEAEAVTKRAEAVTAAGVAPVQPVWDDPGTDAPAAQTPVTAPASGTPTQINPPAIDGIDAESINKSVMPALTYGPNKEPINLKEKSGKVKGGTDITRSAKTGALIVDNQTVYHNGQIVKVNIGDQVEIKDGTLYINGKELK